MATPVLMPKLGLTMTEGTIEEWKIKEGENVKVGDVLFSVATDKLTNDIEADTDAKYGEILGVHILAPHATDLIEEAALAINLECTTEELINTIHCHPTVSEALREGVLAVEKRAIHNKN